MNRRCTTQQWFLAAAALLGLGCTGETATGVIVVFDADAELAARGETLRVEVRVLSGPDPVFSDSTQVVAGDWPYRLTLAPLGNDPNRQWEVVAVLEAEGESLGHQRVIGSYESGAVREVRVVFQAECNALGDCGARQTCRDGSCQPACTVLGQLGGSDPSPLVLCSECPEECGECQECRDGACVPLGEGTRCADGAGQCRAGACCQGCFDGERCEEGSTLTACGAGGSLCETCACEGDRCSAGACLVPDPARRVTVQGRGGCAATRDAAGWCWGSNDTLQLGVGSDDPSLRSNTPVRISAAWKPSTLSSGLRTSCLRHIGTNLACWGYNGNGQLGLGDLQNRSAPTLVSDQLVSPAIGQMHMCALTPQGEALCWGDGSRSNQLGPALNMTLTPMPTGASVRFAQLSAGINHTCGIELGGNALWCWGDNTDGSLGIGEHGSGERSSFAEPQQVATIEVGWEQVASYGHHTCAIRAGELYCWGSNRDGQVGNGLAGLTPPESPNTPSRVGSEANWILVAPGIIHTCGLRDTNGDARTGALWCWGANDFGMVGTGEYGGSILTPVRVGNHEDWIDVATGERHTCGVRASGTVWCWGSHLDGMLGIGAVDLPVAPPRFDESENPVAPSPQRVCLR